MLGASPLRRSYRGKLGREPYRSELDVEQRVSALVPGKVVPSNQVVGQIEVTRRLAPVSKHHRCRVAALHPMVLPAGVCRDMEDHDIRGLVLLCVPAGACSPTVPIDTRYGQRV